MRIGVFGGSFDPVHYGHLLLAEGCREQCALDEVWFLPAALAPHKRHVLPAGAEDRANMLRLAIAGHVPFLVNESEIARGGVSYTVDSLASLAAEHPGHEWFFLMGGDSLADLPKWREPGRICELAVPVVVRRPGSPAPDYSTLAPFVSAERLQVIQRRLVELPQVDISSTDIRHRVSLGRSIRFRTPRAVEMYIQTQGLYREPA